MHRGSKFQSTIAIELQSVRDFCFLHFHNFFSYFCNIKNDGHVYIITLYVVWVALIAFCDASFYIRLNWMKHTQVQTQAQL